MLLGTAPTFQRAARAEAGGGNRAGFGLHCTEGNLKFKEDAISPSWVQMRIQSISQDFQKMIHELEELWCGIFEGRGEAVNSPLLIVSKLVSPRLEPGSRRAGNLSPFFR